MSSSALKVSVRRLLWITSAFFCSFLFALCVFLVVGHFHLRVQESDAGLILPGFGFPFVVLFFVLTRTGPAAGPPFILFLARLVTCAAVACVLAGIAYCLALFASIIVLGVHIAI